MVHSRIKRIKLEEAREKITIGPVFLTRYEKARIIGARALQVSLGAPILIDISGNHLRLMAFIEFKHNRLYVRHIVTHAEYDKLTTKYRREGRK